MKEIEKTKMTREEIKDYAKKEFEIIRNLIKNKNELSHYDFLRIRNFKLRNFSAEEETKIKKVTKLAFEFAEKDQVKEAIELLTKLHGIAIPTASAILSMRFPEKYAIIDIILVNHLGKKEWIKNYSNDSSIYVEYTKIIKERSKKENKTPSEYERAIWEKNFRRKIKYEND